MEQFVAPGPVVGQRVAARYHLDGLISRGGMGDVFEATDERLQRQVAVKVFRADPSLDRQRFDREARVLASLDHPGLVRVFDAGEHDRAAFVVLELVEGPTLAARLVEGALPPDEVADLGIAVGDALAYIHGHGVVHRDVKPSNILCDPTGHPRLVDFGIARVVDATRVTAVATAVGTAAYMAPEQVQGRDVTGAADVYALGLVLLELLTGVRAFQGTVQEVAVARLTRSPDVLAAPGPWRDLLAAMTARAPGDRPSAAEVSRQLVSVSASGARADEMTEAGGSAVVLPMGATAPASDASTQVLDDAATRTDVLPAPLEPVSTAPPGAAGVAALVGGLWARRRVLAVVVVLLGLVAWAAIAAGSDRLEVPSPSTVPVTAAPETTVAPTTTMAPTTTEASSASDEGEGRGKGKKEGHGKEGSD